MGHPLPASHQGQCHQKDRGHREVGLPTNRFHSFLSSSSRVYHFWRVRFEFGISFCWAASVSLYFSPGLSNPQVLRHLGNFLCFRGNPIRILLTPTKSNKNSIYTRTSKIWGNELKTCHFQKSHFGRTAGVTKEPQMNVSTMSIIETSKSNELKKFYIQINFTVQCHSF